MVNQCPRAAALGTSLLQVLILLVANEAPQLEVVGRSRSSALCSVLFVVLMVAGNVGCEAIIDVYEDVGEKKNDAGDGEKNEDVRNMIHR